jgi:hypothetical protein
MLGKNGHANHATPQNVPTNVGLESGEIQQFVLGTVPAVKNSGKLRSV